MEPIKIWSEMKKGKRVWNVECKELNQKIYQVEEGLLEKVIIHVENARHALKEMHDLTKQVRENKEEEK